MTLELGNYLLPYNQLPYDVALTVSPLPSYHVLLPSSMKITQTLLINDKHLIAAIQFP